MNMLVYDICMVFFICYVVLTRKLFICLNNILYVCFKTHT